VFVADHLSDPDFEPSDEQLIELSRRAFEHVPEQRRAALARLHAEIRRLQQEGLRELRKKLAAGK
jgi:hypothetical protein